ncbi:MAG: hypothetical protein JWN01_479 [Patescibacteria group bacterium]|nr:hypothetical protein [Patescibacteria group bacterium]
MKLPTFREIPLVRLWLPYLVMSVGLTTLVYATVQQSHRQAANDPQIQMAEDTAAALAAGEKPSALVPARQVNMRASLAPFLIVTDEQRGVVATSGTLDGATVLPPAGAFAAAKADTGKDTAAPQENRVTWQPNDQSRLAAVIVHYHGGYVVAARNLREVEAREQQLTEMAALVFIGLLAASLILLLIVK